MHSIKMYIENPSIIFLFIIFYGFLFLISFIKAPNIQISPIFDYISYILLKLPLVLTYSLFLSIFFGAAHLCLKNKFSVKKSIKYSRFLFGNFIILSAFILINFVLLFLSGQIGKFLSRYIGESILIVFQSALYYSLFLAASSIFIFIMFFYTIKNKSLKKSFKIMRISEYARISLISAVYLIITFLINIINYPTIKELIYFIFIYPLFTLILINSLMDYK